MSRKYRNIDARTLNLRTGKHQFPVRTAHFEEDEEDFTEDALNTPEVSKGSEIDYLDQLEYRQSLGEELSSEELASLENLGIKYQDAMSRSVPHEFTEDRPRDEEPTSAFEGQPSGAEESGAVQREQSREKTDSEDNARKEFRQLRLKEMWGQELDEDEQERSNALMKQFPDIMKRMNAQEIGMMGMHRPETDQDAYPSTDLMEKQLGSPFDKFFVAEPLRDPNGEIKIDPEVATEEDRLGADYGQVKYIPEFLRSEEHLKEYRNWIESLQGLDPNLVSTNPLERQPAPPWYSLGEQEKSTADIADRTSDVFEVLKNINQMSPEDTRVYTEMFNRILSEWGSYGAEVKSDVIPQFRELLKTKFDMTPDEAGDIAIEVQMALTKELPMSTRRIYEKDSILEEKLQRGEPISQKDRARESRSIQKTIDALGQPLDLIGASSWLESVQSDGRWKRRVMRGETPDGVSFTIDPPEALVAAYNFIAQSPLPDNVKNNTAKILMDPAPYKAFKEKGRGNIGYSKLEQTMNMLSEFALGQYGLYNPEQTKNRKDLYKMDQQQKNERQKLLRTHEQLTEILKSTFDLTHGEALDYLRNTVDGLSTWKQVMNEQAGPKIQTVREQYESVPGTEVRQFLGQFEFGAPEAFLILSGAEKNRTRYPNAPHVQLEGDEIDGRVLDSLQRLWLDPGDKFGRDRLKKFFPGTMQVPTVVQGEESIVAPENDRWVVKKINSGEVTSIFNTEERARRYLNENQEDPTKSYLKMQTRERSDVMVLQEPAVMMGISELINRKREKEEGGMRYQRLTRTPAQRTKQPFAPQKKDDKKKKRSPEKSPPFKTSGLNLDKGNLSLDRKSLRLETTARKAEDIFNMLADYSEALGRGAPLNELQKLFNAKELRKRRQEGERVDDVDHMYNMLRSGLMRPSGNDAGDMEYTVPPEAIAAAEGIYRSDTGILDKYMQLQDLIHNQLERPKDSPWGWSGAPPSLEYNPPSTAHQDYLDSAKPSMEEGKPLAERPSTHTQPPAGTPRETPTPLRDQREKPAVDALGPPEESRPIDITEEGGPAVAPGIDLNKMEEEIRSGQPAPTKPRGREDVFETPVDTAPTEFVDQDPTVEQRGLPEPGVFGPFKSDAPSSELEQGPPSRDQGGLPSEEHPADSLEVGETYGDSWLKIPKEMTQQVEGLAEVNGKVPAEKDYALVRARDPLNQDKLLQEVSNYLLQEQGYDRPADDDIKDTLDLSSKTDPVLSQDEIEELLNSLIDEPFDDDPYKEGALSLRRKSLCLQR